MHDEWTPVSRLQDAVAARLRDLLSIETVASRRANLPARVAEALSRSRGTALLVHVPSARLRFPNLPVPHLDPVTVEVTAFRNTAISPDGPCAADIAIRAAAALFGWTPPGACRPLVGAGADIRCDFDGGYERATVALATSATTKPNERTDS